MMRFVTRQISNAPDAIAPDGSEVRILAGTSRGSMAQFMLAAWTKHQSPSHIAPLKKYGIVIAGQGQHVARK